MRHDALWAVYLRGICIYIFIKIGVNSIPAVRYKATIRWQELLVFQDDVAYT